MSNALRILPEEGSLRNGSPFRAPLSFPRDDGDTSPRALRSLATIIEDGLCHRCGSCVGICPTGVLALDGEEYPTVANLSSCTDCDLCVKVCPGDEFDISSAYRSQFNSEWEPTAIHGHFLEPSLAYATDPVIREHSTSGGVITAVLLSMLERGEIDGAAVIVSDSEELWKGKPIIARSRDEILAAMKSKYAISPTNTVFQQILQTPGRYALVGLPCQIHGFVKAAELDPRLKERVVLTMGLYCHAAVEHDAFRLIWESLGQHGNDAVKFVSRIGKHPGAPHIQKKDRSWRPVYFGDKKGFRPSSMELINIIYRLYTPSRCLTCFDASAEFADIAVGDPWMAPPHDGVDFYKGWSFVLTRTERGELAYREVEKSGCLQVESITEREALHCNAIMATEKRWRAFRVIETNRRQGKAIPAYGDPLMKFPRQSGKQFVKTELHMFTHLFCYLPRFRRPVLRFMLGEGGYFLLWLNNKRRRFRFFIRDTKTRIMNGIFGRR